MIAILCIALILSLLTDFEVEGRSNWIVVAVFACRVVLSLGLGVLAVYAWMQP